MNSPINHAATLRQMADLIDENEALRSRVIVLESELQKVKSSPVKEEQEWYSPVEAAKYIGREKCFLARDRMKRKPDIPCARHGHRTLRYNKADLDAWISSKRKVSPH